ncbi:c-type cytochrome domain-containing protein [Bythopirellula polymerisocia]|uniref:Planctomycete cytochrome C n=1 Tax=Bythopirellula polymerisocia TaxID=2528003 RepID=A0A5C6CSG7_9BACT|nr:c-type cytochrome domain-containing protein [Bythopirellula polymerisocia]TWU27452.1 Planctomycete cytochrome C [Bythopirellula polymerisocia]
MHLRLKFPLSSLLTLLTLLVTSPHVRAAVDYEKQIQPIFTAHCTKCHGEKKALGKLRLQSAEAIQEKLADDEHLIVAGDPESSELYERLVLPADNKKRMPKGSDPLDQAEIDLVSLWIKEGASFGKSAEKTSPPTEEAATVEEATTAPEVKPQPLKIEPLPLPEVEPASEEAIDRLRSVGAQVMPLFAKSNLLDVSFALSSEPANDDALATLAEVGPQVFSLNLRGAQATDKGWSEIAKLTNLTTLSAENSNFPDDAAQYLSGLDRLESLNLYGTTVSDGVLDPLRGLKRLQKIYLWKTKVSYDGAVSLEKDLPGIEWNLGWDHPVVARKRLEQQQVEFTADVKTKQEQTARLQTDLKVAEEAQAAAEKRLQEVDEALKKLSGEKEEPATEQQNAKPDA